MKETLQKISKYFLRKIESIRSVLKGFILRLIGGSIRKLELIQFRLKNEDNIDLAYSSLSPIDDGDENGHYSKALLWALKNRKKEDIKNIALTGPYGSGKSSILKTFQKNYKGNDLKFLNISLATFQEEKPQFDQDGKPIKTDKTALLRLIETSILEQIFYHEQDRKIPDSRFKKIKSYSLTKLIFYSIGYLLFFLAIYNYFETDLTQRIFKNIVLSDDINSLIHYISIFVILSGLFFLILKSVRIISAITINKLKIQNAEIGIGENLSKSILNHHIDEILYFFSVRPYNVVIIEDLDRFQETEIFTKLREVNLLLNNSEKTKRKEIVFVYAVRDDMFTDKERTKFFDFIIPVIPVINSSNSSEILVKKRNLFQFRLSDNLIEDISFFIDDMRLLHNISNEFYLYKEKLNENLNHDKLFAIITYKNIYPNDFMKLTYNEGELYRILNLKNALIKDEVEKIDAKIDELKLEIKHYEELYITNIKELRYIYILKIVEHLSGFTSSFHINNNPVSIDEVTEDALFEYIKANNYKYKQLSTDAYSRPIERFVKSGVKFAEIDKLVNDRKSYQVKEKEILNISNGRTNAIKNKIQDLELQKQQARNLKIAELIKSNQIQDIEFGEAQDKKFITILLRNGYISEDYIDYISLFHEESITRSDYQFHISVKNEISLPFDHQLSKIEKLLPKINLLDFQTKYILNYNILDFLLAEPETYKSQINLIFNQLKNEDKTSIEFVLGYFEVSGNLELFVRLLCERWINIWGYIEASPDFSDSQKNSFFKSIIEYANIEDVIKISSQSSFVQLILKSPQFLSISNDHKKLEQIILGLDLKFAEIDFDNSPKEMLDFIYQNNYYALEPETIGSMIRKYGNFDQILFDNSNYAAIKSSKADSLVQYIEGSFNEYIKNVYLKIQSNVNEKEEHLILLLNSADIDITNKQSIISQVGTKITQLSVIDDSSLYPLLLDDNKLIPSWENLLYEYNSQNSEGDEQKGESNEVEISEEIIRFINVIENAEVLSKVKIPKEVNKVNIYGKFFKKLIQIDEIDDNAYDLITKASPWWYNDLEIRNLSASKVRSLINNTCIQPVKQSFDALKEQHNKLNIYLLEKRKTDFFKILNELTFDSEDLGLVLKSGVLSNSEKLEILNLCPENEITTDGNLKLLSAILLTHSSTPISNSVFDAMLNNRKVSVGERLRHFINNSSRYDLSFIELFLKNLDDDYALITDISLKAKIPKTPENKKLLDILRSKGYISSYSERDDIYRVNHKRK